MTSVYSEKFTDRILDFTVWPAGIFRDLQRETNHEASRIIDATKARGLPIAGILQFKREDLSFEWTVDLDLGVETVSMYRIGLSVPLLVINKKLPWAGADNHAQMSESSKHHMAQNGPGAVFRLAAESVLETLRDITVRWLKTDLVAAESHSHAWAVNSMNRSEVQ